jgi:cytochrome-b5 reductase
MPNRYQLVFLATTLGSFFSLFFLSRYLLRLLKDAGYDPSRIILIGLEHKSPTPLPKMSFLNQLRSVALPIVGETDLVQVLSSPAFVASVFVLSGTAYFISQTGTCVSTHTSYP